MTMIPDPLSEYISVGLPSENLQQQPTSHFLLTGGGDQASTWDPHGGYSCPATNAAL